MTHPPLAQLSSLAQNISVGSFYEHYKGLRYKVLGIARHSETLEEMVVYLDQYGVIWVRPLAMFTENVLYQGELRPRFKLVVE